MIFQVEHVSFQGFVMLRLLNENYWLWIFLRSCKAVLLLLLPTPSWSSHQIRGKKKKIAMSLHMLKGAESKKKMQLKTQMFLISFIVNLASLFPLASKNSEIIHPVIPANGPFLFLVRSKHIVSTEPQPKNSFKPISR